MPALEPALSSDRPLNTVGSPRTLGARPTRRLPNSTMIGELKLTSLKHKLASVGIQAELVGEGVLICGLRSGELGDLSECVAVRKTAKGKVEVEGSVNEVYYKVRREIYGLHALVAA